MRTFTQMSATLRRVFSPNSPHTTTLTSLTPCSIPLNRLAPGFIHGTTKSHGLFDYDADSNGPHDHHHKASIRTIATSLTHARRGRWGTLTELACLPSVSLFGGHVSRRFASKFTVTEGRDALYEAPDFGSVERAVNNPDSNRAFSYFMVGATGVLGAMSAKSTVMNFLASWSASSEALAMAQVEVDLSAIPEGKSVVIKWRGKPIFIRHRTAAEVEEAEGVELAELRDPQRDAERTQKPEWIVMLGICTHLGCVPLANSGDYNGWYCPCQYT